MERQAAVCAGLGRPQSGAAVLIKVLWGPQEDLKQESDVVSCCVTHTLPHPHPRGRGTSWAVEYSSSWPGWGWEEDTFRTCAVLRGSGSNTGASQIRVLEMFMIGDSGPQ